jgi:hypothetical protein
MNSGHFSPAIQGMKGLFKFLRLAVWIAAVPRVVILLIVLVVTDPQARGYALGALLVLTAVGIWFLSQRRHGRRPPTTRGITPRRTSARPPAGKLASVRPVLTTGRVVDNLF